MVLVIDNYDSFTWNLVDILRRGKRPVKVVRNDELNIDEIKALNPQGILISPGPGRPSDSGVSISVVRELASRVPLLGICLGHQLVGEEMGAQLVHADEPMHGRTSDIEHDGKGLFQGLPQPLRVMRYHSLLLSRENMPKDIVVSAATSSGDVMGIRHKIHNLAGVQFHPESILSDYGARIIENWLNSL